MSYEREKHKLYGIEKDIQILLIIINDNIFGVILQLIPMAETRNFGI